MQELPNGQAFVQIVFGLLDEDGNQVVHTLPSGQDILITFNSNPLPVENTSIRNKLLM